MLKPLRTASDFEAVRTAGQRVAGRLCALTLAPAHEGQRAGFITTKRLGNAVKRNRARRLLREALRHNLEHLPQAFDVALVAHHAITADEVRMQQVRDELKWLIERARGNAPKSR